MILIILLVSFSDLICPYTFYVFFIKELFGPFSFAEVTFGLSEEAGILEFLTMPFIPFSCLAEPFDFGVEGIFFTGGCAR